MTWPAPTGEPIRPQPGGPGTPPNAPDTPGRPSGPAPIGHAFPAATAQSPTMAAGVEGPAVTAVLPAPQIADAGSREIQTLATRPAQAPTLAALSERSGKPVRPWTIWVSATLLFGAATAVSVGLLMAMWTMASPFQQVGPNEWTKDDRFNQATWLTSWFPSEPATGWRVFFAIVICAIAVLAAAAASMVGYYAFAGYRWTRFGVFVALGVSLLSLLLNPIAAISIGLVALAAIPLWLPASKRFFARWQLVRHPQIAYSEPIENVFYGPLPRYR